MNELFHYGTPHVGNTPHSGRYQYGSGEKYKEGSWSAKMDFLARYEKYKSEGKSEKEIASEFGLSVNEFRKERSIARNEEYAARRTRAQRLKDHGYSNTEIGRKMGINESSVRELLKQRDTIRKDKIENLADILEKKVKNGEIVDVGTGTEISLNCTATTLGTALKVLKERGYAVGNIEIKQPLDPNKNTTVKYLAAEGTTLKDVWENRDKITTVKETSPNQGLNYNEFQKPTSIDDKRVAVVYRDEGGLDRDGMIGIRKGVEDISLGSSTYAQVRIAINKDGKDAYYIKGMAVYDDNVPDGADIVVYSNKRTRYSNKAEQIEGAFKEVKKDPDNPFGATLTAKGQRYYEDSDGDFIQIEPGVYRSKSEGYNSIDGKSYKLSPVNKLKETGTWDDYNKQLPAQFLSKQSLQLINKQLDLTYKNKYDEYSEIMSLTNPMVKQKLLNDFAEACDKDSRDLGAAALPRQATKVIIPVPELKDNEVYAPTYKNGEELCLVRFPHTGTFEIPKLVVNNKNPEAKKLLGNAPDAIGINKKVADVLSGADFDGDTVLTIPLSDKVKITTQRPLEGLKDFDTQEAYKGYKGMKSLPASQVGKEMGKITNLITDMSLQNPTEDEIVRAVKHSMVIIDAEKHNLNYKQSEKDNGIEALKEKYQRNPDKKKGYGGASSLLSRAGAEVRVPELEMVNKEGKRTYTADPETGKKLMAPTGKGYYDKNGKFKPTLKSYEQMELVDDARKLSNGTLQEEAYASYANKMKALANTSRKEALAIKTTKQDPVAKKNYSEEVQSLTDKLNIAWANKPLERQAQIKAGIRISKLEETNPDLFIPGASKDKLKKEKAKILTESRQQVGTSKHQIEITEKEWEAIQAHAVSDTTLRKILNNSDMEKIRKYSMPRQAKLVSQAKQDRIKSLSQAGFTLAEIAEEVGFSTTTISKYI